MARQSGRPALKLHGVFDAGVKPLRALQPPPDHQQFVVELQGARQISLLYSLIQCHGFLGKHSENSGDRFRRAQHQGRKNQILYGGENGDLLSKAVQQNRQQVQVGTALLDTGKAPAPINLPVAPEDG